MQEWGTGSDDAALPQRGWVRTARRVLATVFMVMVVAWLVVGYVLIVHPHTSRPRSVDAIVVLGPSLDRRIEQAARLAVSLQIPNLLVSVGDTEGQASGGVCVGPPPGVQVTCFRPDPYDTRGEAREVGAAARRNGWSSVIVVAPRPQISRARLLIDRCFSGTTLMVASPDQFSFRGWIYQFIHQSGGFAKAFLEPGC